MQNNHKINLTSLHVVRDELVITIEQAATQLEGFISDRENTKLLSACIKSLQQIRGSLDLIELVGACELSGELLATAQKINVDGLPLGDEKLSALTKGFFVLSCYFEYALQKEWGMPTLLIPYINDIRISNRQAIMWESHFSGVTTVFTLPANNNEPIAIIPEGETIEGMVKRFRHMYQIGLLGVIGDVRLKTSLELMKRALTKISHYAKGQSNYTFWWLACNTVDAFLKQDMAITLVRKRLFSYLDKEFKRIEKEGVTGFSHISDRLYMTEMAYYISLANLNEQPFITITQSFGFGDLGYTEEERNRQLQVLTGPSASAVSSVVATLKTELLIAKEVIENTAESDTGVFENEQDFVISLTKIRDILDIVGLKSAAETMGQQIEKVERWKGEDGKPDYKELMDIADAFLYVESVLDSVLNSNFSDERLSEVNKQSRQDMILNNHLVGAQLIVLEEAETGLTLIKRALSSFSESLYDRVHIKNVTKTMNSVRGGMIVLELPRAAEIMSSSIRFVEGYLLSNTPPAALEHMLETFADTIICLEYYLDCMKVDKFISPDTLIIAEDSLAALGYEVNHADSEDR